MADQRALHIAERLRSGAGGIALRDLAEDVCLSESRLWHLFKEATGSSPAEWAARQRLARARELIETTDMSVKEIAFVLGFKYQSHFTRVFRRAFGHPPLRYRRAVTSQQERINLKQDRDNNNS
jgi:transcriptional regulator GlxA family with amidase domain